MRVKKTVTTLCMPLALSACPLSPSPGAYAGAFEWCVQTEFNNCQTDPPDCNGQTCNGVINPRGSCQIGLWYCPSQAGAPVTVTVITGGACTNRNNYSLGSCVCVGGTRVPTPGTALC